jgi:hypothetical protein
VSRSGISQTTCIGVQRFVKASRSVKIIAQATLKIAATNTRYRTDGNEGNRTPFPCIPIYCKVASAPKARALDFPQAIRTGIFPRVRIDIVFLAVNAPENSPARFGSGTPRERIAQLDASGVYFRLPKARRRL